MRLRGHVRQTRARILNVRVLQSFDVMDDRDRTQRSHRDLWLDWLQSRRAADDDEFAKKVDDGLAPFRDHVLELAGIQHGETVLDVGTGTGLIAFGALENVGPEGRVIFSDISEDCLAHCRARAEEERIDGHCRFVTADAHDLAGIEDESVDVVTTRSVLIYCDRKGRAFEAFHRVLRPGGRLAMFEPINRFGYDRPAHVFRGYDVTPVVELATKVRRALEEHQPAEGSTLLDFDERDLIRMAEHAGFHRVHLELTAMIGPARAPNWQQFYRSAPNPLALTLEEAVTRALDAEEAERFLSYLRPLVENGTAASRRAFAYLLAVKEGRDPG